MCRPFQVSIRPSTHLGLNQEFQETKTKLNSWTFYLVQSKCSVFFLFYKLQNKEVNIKEIKYDIF